MRIYQALLSRFDLNKIIFFLSLLCIVIKINLTYALEIKVLAQVDDLIITNEDLNKEKIILKYLWENRINQNNLDQIAITNLIDQTIKKIELKKNNSFISESEIKKYSNIVLENSNKTIEDFRLKTINKNYEDYFYEKIKIEVSWNNFISYKFSSKLNVNLNEILANNKNKEKDENLEKYILIEKNKKMQSISESYFNELKNKSLIRY